MELVDKIREDDGDRQEITLTFTLSAEEVDAQVDRFFKKAAQNPIPGFRPGKAPRQVIEKGYGGHDNAYAKIAEDIINEVAFAAIDEADIAYLDEPEFNVSHIVVDHKPFTFTVSGLAVPAVALKNCDPVAIDLPPEKATQKEIDEHIEQLRDYYYTFETVEDRAAELGDYVMLNLTCSTDGTEISGLRDTDRLIGLGEGNMPEDFEKHIIGTKPGDELEFDFEVGDTENSTLKIEGPIHAVVKVKEIRVKVAPELDDEFALKLGAQTVEDLYKQIENMINREKHKQLPEIAEERCIDELVERLESDVPEYYMDYMRNSVLRDFFRMMKDKGMNPEEYMMKNGLTGEDLRESAVSQATAMSKRNLALDALFAQLGLELTDEDIDREFKSADDPIAMRRSWEESNNMALLRQTCRRNKALDWLVKNAEVTTVEEDIASIRA